MRVWKNFRKSDFDLSCENELSFEIFRYRLFVTTFLGYGVNEGLRKYEQSLNRSITFDNDTAPVIVKDPCLPLNLVKRVGAKNSSYFIRKVENAAR